MIKATNDNLIVLANEKATTSKMGLAIPVTDRNNEIVIGKVVDIGPGKRDSIVRESQSEIKIGYTVYFPKFNATEIVFEDTKYLIIDHSYILAYEKQQ